MGGNIAGVDIVGGFEYLVEGPERVVDVRQEDIVFDEVPVQV